MQQLSSNYALLLAQIIDRLKGRRYYELEMHTYPPFQVTRLQRMVEYNGLLYDCYLVEHVISKKQPYETLGVFFMVKDLRKNAGQQHALIIYPYRLEVRSVNDQISEEESILVEGKDGGQKIIYVDELHQASQVEYATMLLQLLKFRGYVE